MIKYSHILRNKTISSLRIYSETRKFNWFRYITFKNLRSTHPEKNTNDDEQAYKFGPLYGGESTSFHCHMISDVVFSYSETLESMLV